MKISTFNNNQGFTVVELMVAMVISLLVAIAAITVLSFSRQSANTLDGWNELRENNRLAAEVLQRLIYQAGYERQDQPIGLAKDKVLFKKQETQSPVFGVNDSSYNPADGSFSATNNLNNSDVLQIAFQGADTFPGSGVADGSMISCSGESVGAPRLTGVTNPVKNILYIQKDSSDQGTLMCTTETDNNGTVTRQTVALLQGVDAFKVLYLTSDVTPTAAPASSASSIAANKANLHAAADRYLRADQLNVAGDLSGTNENWRRVIGVKIGLLVKSGGGKNSGSLLNAGEAFYPLGIENYSATASGTKIIVPDTIEERSKYRQVISMTLKFRNRFTFSGESI